MWCSISLAKLLPGVLNAYLPACRQIEKQASSSREAASTGVDDWNLVGEQLDLGSELRSGCYPRCSFLSGDLLILIMSYDGVKGFMMTTGLLE